MADTNKLSVTITGDAEDLQQSIDKAIKAIESLSDKAGEQVDEVADKASKSTATLSQKLNTFGNKASLFLTAPLTAAGVKVNQWAKDYETALVAVKKTVDGTAEDFKKLEEATARLSDKFATDKTEILGVAATAGQLGIATTNIADFTETIIGLGLSTNLAGEEAAQTLAQFANISRMDPSKFNNLGAAIVEVGNNMATTERDVAAMAMRLASAGTQMGLTQGQIVGLAGGLSSLGLEAEMGGTAISKIMRLMTDIRDGAAPAREQIESLASAVGMTAEAFVRSVEVGGKGAKRLANALGMTSKELKAIVDDTSKADDKLIAFAETSGMTTDAFLDLLKADPSRAFASFFDGLARVKANGESVTPIFEALELGDTRLLDAAGRASTATGVLAKAMTLGNDAFNDGTALVNEYSKAIDTNEVKQKRATIALKNAGIALGQQLAPHVTTLLTGLTDLAKGFSSMDESSQKATVGLLAGVAALGPLAKGLSYADKGLKLAKGSYSALAGVASKSVQAFKAARTAGLSFGSALLQAGSSMLNPYALAAGAVTLAIGGMYVAWKRANQEQEKFNSLGLSLANNWKHFSDQVANAKSLAGDILGAGLTDGDIEESRKQATKLQASLVDIWRKASAERRELTSSEMTELQDYIKSLDLMSEKILAGFKVKREVLNSRIDHSGRTSEEVATYLKTISDFAEREKEETEKILNQKLEQAAKLRATNLAEATKIEEGAYKAYQNSLASIEQATADSSNRLTSNWIKNNENLKKSLQELQELYVQRDKIQASGTGPVDTDAMLMGDYAASKAWEEYAAIKRQLDENTKAINAQWTESAQEITAVLLELGKSVAASGGQVADEVKKAFALTATAASTGSDEAKQTLGTLMADMVNTVATNNPEFKSQAEALIKNFNASIESGRPISYNNAIEIINTLLDGIQSGFPALKSAGANINAAIASGASAEIVVPIRIQTSGDTPDVSGYSVQANRFAPTLSAYARGTNYYPGGLGVVNEKGGEIMNLPRGTQIIPHDISLRMAESMGRHLAAASSGGRAYAININNATINDPRDIRILGKEIAKEVARYD